MCPADAYAAKEVSYWPRALAKGDATLEHCQDRPGQCFGLCRTLRSHDHCFALARAFQVNESVVAPRYAQMLFSYACGLGRGSGCTNRTAGIRNTAYPGDPFLDTPLATNEACEFRSFTIACQLDDAWGCAMLGEAYQLGEGTRRDYVAAQRWFGKSCRLAPGFEACTFAKGFPNRAIVTARASHGRGFASQPAKAIAQAPYCAPAVHRPVRPRTRVVHRSVRVWRATRRSVAVARRSVGPACHH